MNPCVWRNIFFQLINEFSRLFFNAIIDLLSLMDKACLPSKYLNQRRLKLTDFVLTYLGVFEIFAALSTAYAVVCPSQEHHWNIWYSVAQKIVLQVAYHPVAMQKVKENG